MSPFTETDIRAGASAQSFHRGMSYYNDGAVLEIIRRDAVITAEVEGSDYEPYEVTVKLGADGGIDYAACTCPYDYGGYCKHIVAVLLAALNDAESIEEKPDLQTLLNGLNEAQLRQLIVNVVTENPRLVAAIEYEVNSLRRASPATSTSADFPPTPPLVDIDAIRRDMRRSFRKAASGGGGGRRGYYYDEYDELYIDAGAILKPSIQAAEALLNRGDPAGAAALLAGVVEEWGECIADLEEWVYEANEDAFDEASSEVDALLAESLLSLPLTTAERKAWRARIDEWADETMGLAISDAALEMWWDYPPLVAAMQGNITEQGAWEGEAPMWADQLARVRLRILERQGRIEEFLNLAQAEGQLVLYLAKLVELGEIERTVAEANAYLGAPGEVLSIARLLDERGHHAEALNVAAHGLDSTYPYGMEELARWLAPRAQAQGNVDLALRAARVAFLKSRQLADYQTAESIAGERWSAVKPELLEDLARSNAYTAVEIYLHEHMLVEAMEAVDKRGGFGVDLVRVIEAVRAEYPDWSIKQCKQQAERIMNNGDAKHYANAADWLRRARTIYAQHNRLAEWQNYLGKLLDIHARKYKLVPLLKEIR
jgi:uncharacterized Zn finger protein